MEYPKPAVIKAAPKKAIGLDMSLPKFYVDSNGQSPDLPKPYREMEPKLARGQRKFVDMLQYKADRKGKHLVKVSRWFPSSKTCLSCGHIHKELSLCDRTYVCPICGHVMDRDHQAAQNILKEAWRMLAQPAPCA